MGLLITIAQFILSLSILVVLHEFGHFLPARLFGIKVEKFYLFFDPSFKIGNFQFDGHLFRHKFGDTEYGVGWLPLGGYVKIAGMIDESMDKEQMAQPEQPWEFRSKPAWQRLIVMLGGVTVNFILGWFLLSMILTTWGEKYYPAEAIPNGIQVDSLGMQMGFQTGDEIISVGGEKFTEFSNGAIAKGVIFDGAEEMKVKRNGSVVTLPVTQDMKYALTSRSNKRKPIIEARMPFVLGKIVEDKPAAGSKLAVNDSLIAVNGKSLRFYDEFKSILAENSGKEITITAIRDQKDTINTKLTVNDCGQIGVQAYGKDRFFQQETREYTFAASIPEGFNQSVEFIGQQLNAFGQMFRNEIKASDSLGGFMSIGSMFGDTWNWKRFWYMTAILSLILGFMNLLPIPALDGGHVMFLIYEAVTGRKLSDKFLEYATIVGFILVFALLIFANGLDIWEWITGSSAAQPEC